MLKKLHRLGANAMASTTTQFRMYTTPFFSVKTRKNDQSLSRCAFVISKKIDKRAVVRNTLKRRMAAAVSQLCLTPPGYDYIFYLKKTAREVSEGELKQVVNELHMNT